MSTVFVRNVITLVGLSLALPSACSSDVEKIPARTPDDDGGEAGMPSSSATGGEAPGAVGASGGEAASAGAAGLPTPEGGSPAGGGQSDGGAAGAGNICPGVSPDTDADGIPDACDDDDDNDGFPDTDDPMPLDASVPGDFSTPAAILADSRVKAALEGAAAKGLNVATHLETDAPDITGYYVLGDGAGTFVATGNNVGIGTHRIGYELRYTTHPETTTVDSADVGFTRGRADVFELANGQLLRGTANEITIYARVKSACTTGNASFTVWSIAIISASVDSATGSWTSHAEVGVDVLTQGTAGCRSQYIANFATVGGWYGVSTPVATKTAVSALKYMCKDEGIGYVPTETWTRSDGSACQCTTNFGVSCK